MDIYKEIIKTVCKRSNHESDLYCEVTPKTKEIINRYEFKKNVTTFRSEGVLWYEIPFAFNPFWNKTTNKEGG